MTTTLYLLGESLRLFEEMTLGTSTRKRRWGVLGTTARVPIRAAGSG